jgi:3-hydroxyacyl-[acyl-carrier-protein] dehydratase
MTGPVEDCQGSSTTAESACEAAVRTLGSEGVAFGADAEAPEGGESGKMEETSVKYELVDINEILRTLPHRYPMLLIDRLINVRSDHSGIGIKNVTYNEPVFLGHFPDRPVYPGVLMIEAMAQTAGVIGIKAMETDRPRAVYFLTIDKCKFRKPVLPGDTIEYHMRSVARRKAMWWFHGDAKVNGTIVAEADVGAMLAD